MIASSLGALASAVLELECEVLAGRAHNSGIQSPRPVFPLRNMGIFSWYPPFCIVPVSINKTAEG
jgi:hypothetical protein